MEKINIIVDTLEKKDLFLFKSYGDVVVSKEHLKTGDYSIRGYTENITIDRKANAGELYINFGTDWKRFKAELERMREYDLAYFVCSFPYEHLRTFPENSGIPKARWPDLICNDKFLRKKIHEIHEQYTNIEFLFFKNKFEAEDATYNLLKEYYTLQNGYDNVG
jgi:hypothetical protein